MAQFSEESRRVATEFFQKFDKNGDGTIYKRDLCAALAAFGCDLDAEGMDFARRQFDTDGDGEIQIEELVDNLDVLIKYSVDGSRLEDAFKTLDRNGDGFITKRELIMILTVKGPNQMNEKEAKDMVEEIFDQFDENKDKKLSYMEFVRMVIGKDGASPPKMIDNLVYNNN